MRLSDAGLLLAALFWTSATTAARTAADQPGLHEGETLRIDGEQREFSYYVPNGARGKTLPMVVYFHGHGDNMRHMLGKGRMPAPSAKWMETAEREKFLVFYPLGLKGGSNKTGWNDCRLNGHSLER